MPAAVSFDVWGTLLRLGPAREAVVKVFSELSGRSPEQVRAAVRDVDSEVKELRLSAGLDGRRTVEESARLLCSRLGCRADVNDVIEAVDSVVSSLRPEELVYPDSARAVMEVREAGLRLGVLGNTLFWTSRATRRLLLSAFGGSFSYMAFADEIGHSKPSPEAFRALLRGLGVGSPQQVVHVGDNPREDLGGALASGLKAVLVVREGLGAGLVLRGRGLAVVPSLEGLAGLVEEI